MIFGTSHYYVIPAATVLKRSDWLFCHKLSVLFPCSFSFFFFQTGAQAGIELALILTSRVLAYKHTQSCPVSCGAGDQGTHASSVGMRV